MSYSDCVSRISQLDSMIRSVDPYWANSGYSLLSTAGEGLNGGSPFSGVLESISGTTASSSTSTSATATFNVLSSSLSMPTVPFVSPLRGAQLTQSFGPSTETLEPSATVDGVTYDHFHNGIDLAAPLGTAVTAAAGGTVISAGPVSDGAVVVKIQHDDGYVSLYAHLDPSLQVAVGQHVAAGQTIGQVGLTGITTGPHLHFGLYTSDGAAVDPSPYLATGHLPSAATLLGPSASDPTALTQISGSSVLARFDAVASRIPYASNIRAAAIANGIDPLLLASLVAHESNFDPQAVSRTGAMGMTQLLPGTASDMGVTDAFNVDQNLNGGAKYLATQLKNFGRVDMALAAYNAGPGTVGRLGAVPDSTQGYISRILTTWRSYQEPSA
jgi:hypothetical protein